MQNIQQRQLVEFGKKFFLTFKLYMYMYSNSLMCQTDYSMHFRSEISLILKLVEIVW